MTSWNSYLTCILPVLVYFIFNYAYVCVWGYVPLSAGTPEAQGLQLPRIWGYRCLRAS